MPNWGDIGSWLHGIATQVTLADLIFWIIVLVVVIVFLKKVGPRTVAAARTLLSLVTLLEAVQGLPAFIARTDLTLARQDVTLAGHEVKLDGIYHETHKNDGSSIKDAIGRVEGTINEVILPSLSGARGAQSEIHDELAALRNTPMTATVEITPATVLTA